MQKERFYSLPLIIALLAGAAFAQASNRPQPQESKKSGGAITPQASPPIVNGAGTIGRIPKWTVFSGYNYTLGDSVMTESNGNIGIGTSLPTSKLTVAGLIESLNSGIKFPDGTIQATSATGALFSVAHDSTLLGNGTAGSPLGVAVPLTLSGAGSNTLLTVLNSTGTGVHAQGGSSALDGFPGVVSIGGNSPINSGADGVVARGGESTFNPGGSGVKAVGANSVMGLGGFGVSASGGNSPSGSGGDGVHAEGGNGSSLGGNGVVAIGGRSVSIGLGGNGVVARGGRNGSTGGNGVDAKGGDGFGNTGGAGVKTNGGDSDTSDGGTGVRAFGGTSDSHTGGEGVLASGGDSNSGTGGKGLLAIPGFGPLGFGLAGDFVGNVHVSGTLSKGGGSFKIDHPLDPENRYLYHSFVESPDMKNIYDGNVVTDANGEVTVELPDYFEALNRDFRYQLTVVGTFAQVIVGEEIKGNRFVIRTNAPNVKVSWQVTGIRQDAWANKNRIKVEVKKTDRERGHYLHPEAFDQPEELSIEWARNPEMMKKRKEARERAKQIQQ